MPGSCRHVNRRILTNGITPHKINLFTPVSTQRLRQATRTNRTSERWKPAVRILQKINMFTRVNANPAACSFHSSHLGVTCHTNPDAVGSASLLRRGEAAGDHHRRVYEPTRRSKAAPEETAHPAELLAYICSRSSCSTRSIVDRSATRSACCLA
jgi:hypothetical protein